MVQARILTKEPKKERFNTMDTCLKGMRSVVNNYANKDLVDQKIVKEVSSTSFKVDYIHLVKVIDEFHCDVLTRDPKGVRRFFVSLDKSMRFKHGFMIKDIKELKVSSRYQL